MSNNSFHPNWASAPGSTIADILHERQLSDAEFARRLGFKNEDVDDLLAGRAAITIAAARELQRVLGGSVEFWMARDFQYRQDIARSSPSDEQWLLDLPMDDMVRFGWIARVSGWANQMDACLRFFDVPSVRDWSERYASVLQLVAFKRSAAFESRPASVAAWLRKGEIEGAGIRCKPWDGPGLRDELGYLKSLTRHKDPSRFVPALQECCARCGVAVVIVRAPKGCPADGATKFLAADKALLLLSFRYLTDDHFWFAFFHEVGHLLLHGKSGLFLEGTDMPVTVEEAEADDFAANVLVPAGSQSELRKLRTDHREVIRFAMKIGVSPGIVVGQLQHLGIVNHRFLNGLKRRYRWGDEARG